MSERNSKIELLRIISMIMIVIWHAIGYSKLLDIYLQNKDGIYYSILFLETLTIPATNIFVLNSSYFLSSTKFKVQKSFLYGLKSFSSR